MGECEFHKLTIGLKYKWYIPIHKMYNKGQEYIKDNHTIMRALVSVYMMSIEEKKHLGQMGWNMEGQLSPLKKNKKRKYKK